MRRHPDTSLTNATFTQPDRNSNFSKFSYIWNIITTNLFSRKSKLGGDLAYPTGISPRHLDMDVTKQNFQYALGQILDALTNADFVAFDFEFSGIPSRANLRPALAEDKLQERPRDGRQSLQARYTEAKEAAEKFQILQVGLTVVEQSPVREGYVLRPFNMFLNPCLERPMEIERTFSFQSGSVDFLVNHGFAMDGPFSYGVPYLSRLEQDEVMVREAEKIQKSGIADIILRDDDVQANTLLVRVRKEIKAWKALGTSEPLVVTGDALKSMPGMGAPLNNFQRRLIHQVVRAEFSDCLSESRGNHMHVFPRVKEREDKVQASRLEAVQRNIAKQVGLRWCVEAIVGGDLSMIDASAFHLKPGELGWVNVKKAEADFAIKRRLLQERRPVIVVHNGYLDLMYLYRTFIGPLPESSRDFSKAIHQLFPMVVDTKYLATHRGVMGNTSLQELHDAVASQGTPLVHTHYEHSRYDDMSRVHEAGFDSFITARVAIRLASKLAAVETWKQDLDKEDPTAGKRPPENGIPRSDGSLESPTVLPAADTPARSKYASKGMFDLLSDNVTDHSEQWDSILPEPVDRAGSDPRNLPEPVPGHPLEIPKWMPAWNSDFWTVYGNKLRMNGTVEGVLELAA